MSIKPILNPELPYVGEVENGLIPGKMVKIHGNVPPESTGFAINYQLGPGLNPRDDVALHVSPRFHEGFIIRNHIRSMEWGAEENTGPIWIVPGQSFEIIILCENPCFKIAINGKHFTEFAHRLPYSQITHLVIDGNVQITSIFYESILINLKPSADTFDVPNVVVGPPPSGKLYPMLYPHGFPKENDEYTLDMNKLRNNNHGIYKPQSDQESGDVMDKVGLVLGGLAAVGGAAVALHAYNKNKNKDSDEVTHNKNENMHNESGLGRLSALGAALASQMSSNTFHGDRATHDYSSEDKGMLGSILGLMGTSQQIGQPKSNPLGDSVGSILGEVFGGSGYEHNQHQLPRNYGNNSHNLGEMDLASGLGGTLIKSAMDSLSKHLDSSSEDHHRPNTNNYTSPPVSANYMNDVNMPQIQSSSEGEKFSIADISKGLGFNEK